MSLPFATSTFTFNRRDGDVYQPDAQTVVLVGTVPGVLSSPRSRGQFVGGTQESVDRVLNCEQLSGIAAGQTCRDNTSGETYLVLSVEPRYELGMSHLNVNLHRSEGAAP